MASKNRTEAELFAQAFAMYAKSSGTENAREESARNRQIHGRMAGVVNDIKERLLHAEAGAEAKDNDTGNMSTSKTAAPARSRSTTCAASMPASTYDTVKLSTGRERDALASKLISALPVEASNTRAFPFRKHYSAMNLEIMLGRSPANWLSVATVAMA